MRSRKIFLVTLLVCPFVIEGRAATPLAVMDSPAELETLRPGAAKVAPATINTPSPVVERAIRGNPLWSIPLRQLTATRERPLFAPSRRAPAPAVASAPPPPPPPAEKPPETEPLQLSLTGTVAGGDGAIGVFLDKATGMPLRLKVGQKHKGWTLRSVGRRDVVLARGMTTTKLAMVAPEPTKKGPEPAKVAPREQASAPLQSPLNAQPIETAGTPRFDPAELNIFKLPKRAQ